MEKYFIFVVVATLFVACTFDSSGLAESNNTNNNTNNSNLCEEVDCGHGSCVVEEEVAACRCEEQWTGDNCDQCIEGYTGDNCDECANGTLQLVDGSCIDDPCAVEGVCSGHGTCSVDLFNGEFSCDCSEGYTGDSCADCAEFHVEFPAESGTCLLDACIGVDCGHGTCRMTGDEAFVCDCSEGYIGDLCILCDEANDYLDHDGDGSCELSPCHGFDCGGGTCEITAEFTARCQCPDNYTGEHCEQTLTAVLIYRDWLGRLFVQVRGSWGNFLGDVRVVYQGDDTGSAIIYYISDEVDENGWLELDPCVGSTESVLMVVAEPPYAAADTLQFTNGVTPDAKDPNGYIYTDSNGTFFKADCQCAFGVCAALGGGNDP